MIAKRMLASLFAALLALGAVACEVDDVEDPLIDDNGVEDFDDDLDDDDDDDL